MTITKLKNSYPIAIPFKRHHELEGKVKEYNIVYRTDDSRMDDLIDFVSLPFVERVNVEFMGKIPIKIVQTVNKIKDCIYVRILPHQWVVVDKLQEEGIRFFFDSNITAGSYCKLDEILEMGVTDVYISDDLTYNLKEVQDYCHKRNVQLRLVVNRIPMTTINKGSDLRSPIYRPQDMSTLKRYYDVFEIDCGKPYNWHIFNVEFKSYFVNEYWHGNLAELNRDITLFGGFPNDHFHNAYTLGKLNCQRVCSQRITNHCNKCEQYYDIAKTFIEKGVAFK